MPAATDHPAFSAPADPGLRIWRYIGFTKYVAMLESSALYFSRADLLGDPYEGATSHFNTRLRPQVYDNISPDQLAKVSNIMRLLRAWTYVNCWHVNPHESAAMWSLYGSSDDAIALQSTYQRLCDSLPETVNVGMVKYLDYESEWMPEGNTLYPIMHKRRSFEHERELRAVVQDLPASENDEGRRVITLGRENSESGKKMSVSLEQLIEKVYVCPTAPEWFATLVEQVSCRYSLNTPIITSSLAQEPVY